jgi:hypothetical protein
MNVKRNLGLRDVGIRFIAALAIAATAIALENIWIGLFVPAFLFLGYQQWCPIYALLGINTYKEGAH